MNLRPEIIPYVVAVYIASFILVGVFILAICFAVDPHINRKPYFSSILYTVSAISGVLVFIAMFQCWLLVSTL
jgi:chromate transport protein ChrA